MPHPRVFQVARATVLLCVAMCVAAGACASAVDTWVSTRAARGIVHVAYRVHVAPHKVKKRGPMFDLQEAGGGVSGAFAGFLLLPDVAGASFDTQVHGALSAGETAITSYGEGDYRGLFTAGKLHDTLFLAGPVIRHRPPGQVGGSGLDVYALGLSQARREPG